MGILADSDHRVLPECGEDAVHTLTAGRSPRQNGMQSEEERGAHPFLSQETGGGDGGKKAGRGILVICPEPRCREVCRSLKMCSEGKAISHMVPKLCT